MTPEKKRQEIIKQFEIEYEKNSEAQKRIFEQFSEDMDNQIPQSIEQIRQEISDKIKKFNENNY